MRVVPFLVILRDAKNLRADLGIFKSKVETLRYSQGDMLHDCHSERREESLLFVGLKQTPRPFPLVLELVAWRSG